MSVIETKDTTEKAEPTEIHESQQKIQSPSEPDFPGEGLSWPDKEYFCDALPKVVKPYS